MKKIIVTMMVALLVGTTAMAQESQNERRHPGKFDKTEMIKHRTDETVSRYKLNDKQAKQLLELNAASTWPQKPVIFLPVNATMIPGKDMIDAAKMIGITPAVFTRSGIWEEFPPTIRRPTIFVEY